MPVARSVPDWPIEHAKCRECLTYNLIPAEWRGFFIDSVTCHADQSVVVPTHSKPESRSDDSSK